ncbi:hypothetical protein BS333_08695 [Vibrio azureus]|uniref:Uncharacterized protein n=1 Tax=Vibrio azureus NBRC 104587 TaxID=1219077 RepID=U3AL91_9VIBR|nr:hypothetical protein [Vibrio azureus]AUI86458.1 hypothetical protein BS333_08695 [Vibrio azureus]GAD74067.1 hypothetical protein VAZ01S_001_00050 [Vibrio azureus NBRC 104587]
MKKSAITLGLLLGGLTASAAWAIDSDPTAPVQGHKPTVTAPVVTTTDILWTPADIEVEFDSPTLKDQDDDPFTTVTYWLEDQGGQEYGKDEGPISDLASGSITFQNYNELKNKNLQLVWQVHTQYGYPSTTLVSDEMTSNSFTVRARMDLTISGTAEVGETLTVHADDGAVVDLAIADVTFTLTENSPGNTAGLYPKGDAETELQKALVDDGNDLTFVLPKELQGYTIKATMEKDPITRSTLR